MVSFAAGLVHKGFIPYTFSMALFLAMRAFEQCRIGVAFAYADIPVRLVGEYAGLLEGISGATHWAIGDCGIMTAMPGMVVLESSDAIQAKRMLDATLEIKEPVYIRSSVEAVRDTYPDYYEFELCGSTEVIGGEDAAILCSGVLVQHAMDASIIGTERRIWGICSGCGHVFN